jgi:hypothetical protein
VTIARGGAWVEYDHDCTITRNVIEGTVQRAGNQVATIRIMRTSAANKLKSNQ